jgi:hypothetical protein
LWTLKGESKVETSVELKNAVLGLYESMSKGDVSAIENIFSRRIGVLGIGSDPNEWWADYDTIVSAFKAQMQEMGTKQTQAGDIEAFVEGSVGWAYERRIFKAGKELSLRHTFVFHKENEKWKIVQLHVSFGIPNSEVLG